MSGEGARHALVCTADQETTLQDKFLIAVVDDDESMREAVKGLLRSLGYEAVAFDRAEDFVNFDRRGRVDCLIADVQMPGLTGPDLHARLVASGETIRTILITAYPDPVVRTRALRAGVQCYLAKPFRDEDLHACIRSALGSDSAFNRRQSGDEA
jgi:FixJ family two-component response regulator